MPVRMTAVCAGLAVQTMVLCVMSVRVAWHTVLPVVAAVAGEVLPAQCVGCAFGWQRVGLVAAALGGCAGACPHACARLA